MNIKPLSHKFSVVFLALGLLNACSSGGGDDTSLDTGANGTDAVGNTSAEGQSDASQFDGETGPSPSVVGLIDPYFGHFDRPCNPEFRDSGSITISAETLVQIDTVFNDANCTQPTQEQVVTYTVIFPGDTTSTVRGDAIHVDQTLQSWVIDGELANQFGTHSTFYQIMLLDGNNLYLADGRGDTPEERPTTLNTNAYIRR